MINRIVFQDEITLWWDWNKFENATQYRLYLDGKYHGESKKTHYTFCGLKAKTTYQVCVEAYDGEELVAREEYKVQTKEKKNVLDV